MEDILSGINSPEDLNSLNEEELEQLAEEIREYLIDSVSESGGHLASNLGVVELTVALHRHLESPRDKIIWDVGHQSYPHKILTGRKDELSTIRQKGGLSGFPKNEESEHDIINTGHSSTSISSALGLARARDHKGSREKIYCVIGDGAITGGVALEGLNHAGDEGADINVILNDNEMSIASNVGALSDYLSRLRTEPGLRQLSDEVDDIINAIPGIGGEVSRTVDKAKDSLKYFMVPGVLFEEMGFTYLGPIAGHDISTLREVFSRADKVDGPVLIHTSTVKGKGYDPAEESPDDYHGVSPFKIENGEQKKNRCNPTYSQIFGKTLRDIGRHDIRVVGITAAMPSGTGMEIFAEEFPERFYDVGIAEQHALTFSAGLARGGMRPFAAIYSTFLQRGYDQVIHDICLQNLPVTIGIDRAGIVGGDGETHQGLFDISYLRAVPNLVFMAPRNENELVQMMWTAHELESPAAIRYPRGEGEGVKIAEDPFLLSPGRGELLKEGEDVFIVAVGSMVNPALKAAEILRNEGIKASVFNARFIKPLDERLPDLIEDKGADMLVTVEENVLAGGFGSLVVEACIEAKVDLPAEVLKMGIPDEFVPHGGQQEMRKSYNLHADGIARRIRQSLEKGI